MPRRSALPGHAQLAMLAVLQPDDLVGQVHERLVVRGHQGGDPLRAHHGEQQAHDLPPGLQVELAGRLVGDQQLRAPGQRPGDRDALLLAAGQLVRAVRGVLGEPDDRQHRRDPLLAAGRRRAGDPQRDPDVLRRRQHRDQPERLEDERDRVPAQFHPLPLGHPGDLPAGHRHGAPGRGVQAADDVQQRGLARAGPAAQRR